MIKVYAYLRIQGVGPVPYEVEYEESFRSMDAASEVSVADLIELAMEDDLDDDEDDEDDDEPD